MTDTAGAAGATPSSARPQSEDEKLLDALIFKKDLNEVHLLVDLISGRTDRSLSMLTMPDPDQPSTMLTSAEILKRITLMRYPPTGTDAMHAANAAILLMAKDRLTWLADPARGLTIAYTMMFADAEPRIVWSYVRNTLRRRFGSVTVDNGPGRDTGVDVATRTFPRLQAHAERFRFYRTSLGWLAILWLLLTAFTFWDATLGRTALEHGDQNWKAYIDAVRDSPQLMAGDTTCKGEAVSPQSSSPPPQTAADAGRTVIACRKLLYLKKMADQSNDEIAAVFGCRGMSFSSVFHVWCWHWMLSGKFPASTDPNDLIHWQVAASIMSVFTSYILPMMFALLGTLIGAFRSILNKIGNSSLAPRDMVGMLVGIPVGLVAGIAVGLFLSPSSIPTQGAGGVGGTFTLTASGLGFVAGYSSQSFFSYLDYVISTIFPTGASTNAHTTALALAASAGAATVTPRPGGSTGAPSTTGPTGISGPGSIGATGASGAGSTGSTGGSGTGSAGASGSSGTGSSGAT